MAEDTSAHGDTSNASETDTPSDETDADGIENSGGEKVSHRQKRLIASERNWRERAKTLESKLKEIEDTRLHEQGNKDELIKRLQSKLDGETKRTKEIYGNFARKSVNSQIKSAALEAGAVDADVVLSLADISSLEIDPDTFEANADDVKDIVNGLKKSKAFLFQKPGPKLNGKLPNGQAAGSPRQPDFNSMKPAEIQKWLKENAHLFK